MKERRLSWSGMLLIMLLSGAAPYVHGADELDAARAAFDAKDPATAMRLLRPLAERGDARAQYGVGTLYAQGFGVERNVDEARRWFLKAAAQGEPRAEHALGVLYTFGNGVKQDYAEAATWLRKAAEQGFAPSQVLLGTLYGAGDGVPRDFAEAKNWYTKAADQGNGEGQWRLAAMYLDGEGGPVDYAQAHEWFKRAASQEFAAGYLGLGHLHLHGLGQARDVNRAAEWFKLVSRKVRSTPTTAAAAAASFVWGRELLQRAMEVGPMDLASAYVTNSVLLRFLTVAEGGGTLVTPTGTFRADNAGPVKRETQSKLSTYAAAIIDRGYRSIGGRYRPGATASCERTGSSWAGSIRAGFLHEINIHQDAFELRIAQSADPKAKRSAFDADAVVVESTLAFVDPGNSEFMFSGTIASEKITLAPHNVDGLLARWPKWAKPPSREDLAACTVTLTPIPK